MTTWKMALLSMSGGLNGNILKKIWDLECASEGDESLESSTARYIPNVRDFLEDPVGPLEGATPQGKPLAVSSHGAQREPHGPFRNTQLLQEHMKAPPNTPPARQVPSITDFLGSFRTASTSSHLTTPTSLPHSTTPTSLPHSTTPTSLPHSTTPTLSYLIAPNSLPHSTTPISSHSTTPTSLPHSTTPISSHSTTPTSLPHSTTPTSLPHSTTPISSHLTAPTSLQHWTHIPDGRTSGTTLLSPANPMRQPGVPAQPWDFRPEGAKELLGSESGDDVWLGFKSGVDQVLYSIPGVDSPMTSKTGVDSHVQLRTGVDNHVQLRTGVDNHVQLRTGVDNHVQPRTGVDNHVQLRTGVDNHVQLRTGVDNHVQPRTGVDSHVQPRTGVDNYVQLRTGVDNHVQPRTGVDNHVQPRTGVVSHVHCGSTCGGEQSLNSISGVKRPLNVMSDSLYLCAWKPANLVGLPYELLEAILDSLSDPDLLTCRLVCRRLGTAATDKLRGHKIVLSKRSDVGESDFDMISLIQPISLEMSHVTGHVTMECIRRFIQSCSKSVKVFKYINSHFISPLGTRIPLLFTLSFHWSEVVALEVMFLHSLFSQDVITTCLQQFNNLQRISLDGNPKSCKTAIRTLASYHSGLKYLSVPAHSLMSISGQEVVSKDKQSLRDTLEELEIKSIPKPNLDWLSMFGEVLRSLKNLVALSLSARVELTMVESQFIVEAVKASQPGLALGGDGQVSFRMQWRQ